MAWTPREDAALLHARTKQRELLTPALQQPQWQEMAWQMAASRIAAETGADLRTAEDCQQRYKMLLAVAEKHDQPQWPGNEKMREMLQVVLGLETVVSRAVDKENQRAATDQQLGSPPVRSHAAARPAHAASTQSPVTECPAVVGPATDTGTSVAVRPTAPSRSKRSQGCEVLKEWTVGHDELVLRAVAEISGGVTDAYRWHRVRVRVTTESLSDVRPRMWRDTRS